MEDHEPTFEREQDELREAEATMDLADAASHSFGTNLEHDTQGNVQTPGDRVPHKEWDPNQSLRDLFLADQNADGSPKIEVGAERNANTAKQLFEENVPLAAMSICHIAVHGQNENTRLKAAVYVVERVLGRPDANGSNSADPFEEFVRGVTSTVLEP